MQWLARICIRRPVFASVLMLVLVVLGVVSYRTLGLDYFPNADLPVVVVTATMPGAAAEEIESELTEKLEGTVNTISGIDELRSTSSEGVSLVIATFVLDKPIDVAAQEVRDKLTQLMPELPKGIDMPVVRKVDPGAVPVLYLALRSKQALRGTSELADKVVRREIENIDGVGQVQMVGARKRQINVLLDPLKLRAQGLTSLDVQRVLATQNLNVPGGAVETGPINVTLRVAGRVDSLEQVGRMVVREQKGHLVRIEDVATVEDGLENEESCAQFDDEPTVLLTIRKQSGRNTVAVVDAISDRLDAIRSRLPAGMALDVVYDNSSVIRTSLDNVLEHIVLGAFCAVAIVLLFLSSGRSTVIAALAIPISIVGTFAAMKALGFSLNFLTLLALALAVGLVIDDAIVVIENIVSYVTRKGMKPFPAAAAATKDIGLAVLATTLSLMAVFVPVSFMGGIVGRFLRSFALTMTAALAVSLIVSFSLTPMLGARWLRSHDADKPNLLMRISAAFYGPIEGAYLAMLRFAMRHRWLVVGACVVMLALTPLIAKPLAGGFMPSNDKAQFQVTLRAPEGTSVEETRLVTERFAGEVRGLSGVTHTLITIGDDDAKTANLATVRVLLTDPRRRDVSQEALMARAREVAARLPAAVRVMVAEVPDIAAGQATANISYVVSGPDLSVLQNIASSVVGRLRKVPGAVDVDSTLVAGKPEARVSVDRDRAADLGVQVSDVAATLRLFVGGVKASTFAEAGEQYDIRLRGAERFRRDTAPLDVLTVPSTKYGSVPLGAVLRVVDATGPSSIDRLARTRQVTISANAAPGVGENTVEAALKSIAGAEVPAGYRLAPAGRTKEAAKMGQAFVLAFFLSFLFMYLVLAAQFESWLEPLIILTIVPLTIPFGMLSLLIFGQSINMFSMLGLLVLFGVVQKNAVLQIDHMKQLRAQGKSKLDAIIEANRDRLRPILMTTLAFVAGMVPLVLSRGIGAGNNRAMSGVVVGGQSLSLLLTLLASPVIYSLVDDAAAWVRHRWPKRRTTTDTGESELALTASGAETGP